MTATNTQLTIDFHSISYCSFYYKNKTGEVRRTKPRHETVRGQKIPKEFAFPLLLEYPSETCLERAKRLGIVDVWIPICRYQFRNNHSIKFTGQKAIDRHKQYCKHIYNK